MNNYRDLIISGNTLDAIDSALESKHFESVYDVLLNLRIRFLNNESHKIQGIIDIKEYSIVVNRVNVDLLDIINSLEQKLNENTIRPDFSNTLDLKGAFRPRFSLKTYESTTVENLSWSREGKYLLIHYFDSPRAYIWNIEKDRLAAEIRGSYPLSNVSFHRYDNSIVAVEGDNKVILWNKHDSTNSEGYTWHRKLELSAKCNGFTKTIISDLLYGVLIDGKEYSYVLVNDEDGRKEDVKLMFWTKYDERHKETELKYKIYSSRIYRRSKLKYIDLLDGFIAVVPEEWTNDEIVLIKHGKIEEIFAGNDIDGKVTRFYDTILVAKTTSVLPASLISADFFKFEYIDILHHWSRYDRRIFNARFNRIKIFRSYPFPFISMLVTAKGKGDFYWTRYKLTKSRDKIREVLATEIKAHKEEITKLETGWHFVTTSGKDEKLKIWVFDNRDGFNNIATIDGIHPTFPAFSWRPKKYHEIAYSDTNGTIYLLGVKKNYEKLDERWANFWTSVFVNARVTFYIILPTYIFLLFYLYNSDSKNFFLEPTLTVISSTGLDIGYNSAKVITIFYVLFPMIMKSIAFNQLNKNYPWKLEQYSYNSKGIKSHLIDF
ncbi:MAG: hypothetical protein AAF741_14475 [Bacteroidota bacterium]